jgi:HEAT repeat protein
MVKVEPKLAVELLASATSDPNPIVRAEAGRVLVGTNGSVAVLRKLLDDPSGQVRLPVAEGLVAERGR